MIKAVCLSEFLPIPLILFNTYKNEKIIEQSIEKIQTFI